MFTISKFKINLIHFIFIVTAILLISTTIQAADVNVTSSVNTTEMHMNELLEYNIKISGAVDNFPSIALPEIIGFVIYSSGTNQSYLFSNGRTENSKNYKFTLSPQKTGKLSIPPFKIAVNGKEYTTNQHSIMVKKSGQTLSRNTVKNNQNRSQTNNRNRANDYFIRSLIDKDTVYVNEQLTYTFLFYSGGSVLRQDKLTKPQLTGFWVEELSPPRYSSKTIEGRQFKINGIRTALFPTSPGKHTIGSRLLDITVPGSSRRDPFDFFGSRLFNSGERLSLKANPIDVTVLPLPIEGKPEDFSGAVGTYKIKATVDKKEVAVNDAVTVKIKISGTGNIKTLPTPDITELPDFRTYTSGTTENIVRNTVNIGGSKVFEQVFIPKRAGNYSLPEIKFSYFDPIRKEYKTITTEPLKINVSPAADRYATQLQNMGANNLDLIAKDIRYLKADIGRENITRRKLLATNPLFLFIYLVPILSYVGIISHQRRKDKLASDHVFRRIKQAKKMAERRLSTARKFLDQSDPDNYYAEINKSINEYFADRFNLSAQGLTSNSIKEYAEGKLNEDLTKRIINLLQICDFGRFAPGASEKEQMEHLWKDARQLIIDLEKSK